MKDAIQKLAEAAGLQHLVLCPTYHATWQHEALHPEDFAGLANLTCLTHLSLNGIRQLEDEGAPPFNYDYDINDACDSCGWHVVRDPAPQQTEIMRLSLRYS